MVVFILLSVAVSEVLETVASLLKSNPIKVRIKQS